MSVRLGRFMERSGMLPTTQFAYRKNLGTCDALLCLSNTLQSELESGQEARIVKIDSVQILIGSTNRAFSINSALWVLTQFLSNRSQHVMVDGCRSKLVNFCIRSAAGQCFGPVIVHPVHFGAFLHS